jgi:hypothetical protein
VPELSLTVDTKAVERLLRHDLPTSQIPYATALAINGTLKRAQAAVRTSLDRHFTIAPSRRAFLARTIRIARDGWATKKTLVGRMDVGMRDKAYNARDRSFLLGRHEEGGTRTADPIEPFFIPTEHLRKGPYDVPPQRLYPRALRLYQRRDPATVLPGKSKLTKSGKVQRQGKRATFIIDNSTPGRLSANPNAHGIYERTGKGRRDIRLLWAFRRTIQLKPRLAMLATTRAIHAAHFDEEFAKAMDRALATARP